MSQRPLSGDLKCDVRDIATKSFFLGPQAENGEWFQTLIGEILKRWLDWRKAAFPEDGSAISGTDQMEAEFRDQQNEFRALALQLAHRFESEIPKFSPRYLGHMFSEISLPALIGHWLATLHNPNNISSESGPVGVQIEREAIAELAAMLGYSRQAPGHFTSCGTVANIEAALRARDRAIDLGFDPVFLVPENKHYSWLKAAHVLGLRKENLVTVDLDRVGTLCLSSLKSKINEIRAAGRMPTMIVSVVGTTELGNVDPVDEVQDLIDSDPTLRGCVWHHVDAAYGGFVASLRESSDPVLIPRAQNALRSLSRVDSITIDPHKLGYVPYACGALLCRDRRNYVTKLFDSPYIQYRDDQDPGLFTLEGSRSASGAAATWLTLKAIGAGPEGYGRIIARTIRLRREMEAMLRAKCEHVRLLPEQHTNILCFTVGKRGGTLSDSNAWVEEFYGTHSSVGAGFFVSKTALSLAKYRDLTESMFESWQPSADAENLHLIRLSLMNPFLQSKEMKRQIMEEFCAEVMRSVLIS